MQARLGRDAHVRGAPSASASARSWYVDRLRTRHRVDLRPEPTEPDEHARAIRAGRQRLGELAEQREHVLLPLSRRLVQIGGPEKAPRPGCVVGLGRQRGSPLRQRSGHLRGAARVEAIADALSSSAATTSLGCVRAPAEVESAFVRILEHGRERDVDETSLLGRVHVEQRRSEQRVREPEAARRRLVDDPRGA